MMISFGFFCFRLFALDIIKHPPTTEKIIRPKNYNKRFTLTHSFIHSMYVCLFVIFIDWFFIPFFSSSFPNDDHHHRKWQMDVCVVRVGFWLLMTTIEAKNNFTKKNTISHIIWWKTKKNFQILLLQQEKNLLQTFLIFECHKTSSLSSMVVMDLFENLFENENFQFLKICEYSQCCCCCCCIYLLTACWPDVFLFHFLFAIPLVWLMKIHKMMIMMFFFFG